ncbi:hypothetical protein EX30DRAFT_366234 [Ascodesmis nigricans]|uniref:RRM domain-containing protein n=1 Tax=Ascodesmis nigricans TaxID=341454 RepID=A0A4S2MM17_9PEZI|nr:hypothetical protein EX30DRAFT_366234 [Ascodesmis nigricans]
MGASAARKAKRRLDGTTKPEDITLANPESSTTAAPSATSSAATEPQEAVQDASADVKKAGDGGVDSEEAAAGAEKNIRFIAFVGNLPYTATKESLETHFKSVEPASVRLITDKADPSKCKGYAFVEFEKYDRMKFCLEKLHHSMFDDGVSEPRKINIELTAGGGGKTSHRRQKLAEKNQKLNEQRRRRYEAEMSEKNEKSAKRAAEAAEESTDIHPSRRRRVRK